MPISFLTIPPNIRRPGAYIEINNSQANQGLTQYNTRLLVIGQMLSTGTATPNVPVLVNNAAYATQLFGIGSMLANMFNIIGLNNTYTETWALPVVDDGSAVAATGTIAFSGTPTAAGTLFLYIAGHRNLTAVSITDTATSIATNVAANINADPTLPVTASASSGTVTLTAKNKGLVMNEIDVEFNFFGISNGEVFPTGVTATITAMASGTVNPSLTTAIANLPDQVFDFWVTPYTDATSYSSLNTELTSRWSGLRMLEGMCFGAKKGTVGTLQTYGGTVNSPYLSVIGFNGSPSPSYEWAAAYAAQVAYSGTIDPAIPFRGLPLLGILRPPMISQFKNSDQNTLLYSGVATYEMNQGQVVISRAITTYQKNAYGALDPSYLDVTTLLTLAYLTQDARTFISQRYQQYKLAQDGTRFGSGQRVVTPTIIRNDLIARAMEWEEAGLIQDIDQFSSQLIVQINANDPTRVDALMPPNLVSPLYIFADQIQFLL